MISHKSKKKFLLLGLASIVALSVALGISGVKTANADTALDSETNNEATNTEEEASPRLFTTMRLSIGGKDGYVWGKVSNEFTLGFSTVRVYVELYSSYTYQETYSTMTLESRNYIEDLNIWQSLETSAPTGGETKYWMARARYRADSGDWEEKVTSLWHIDGNGNKI